MTAPYELRLPFLCRVSQELLKPEVYIGGGVMGFFPVMTKVPEPLLSGMLLSGYA